MNRESLMEALLELDTASMEFNGHTVEDMSDFTDAELQKLYDEANEE